MPAILPFYDVNDKDVNELGMKENQARQKDIKSRWAYYDGDHPKPLKVPPGKRDDNVILNLCGRTVDKTTEFVGVPMRFEVKGGAEVEPGAGGLLQEETAPEQQALDDLWERCKEWTPDVFTSGQIAGHVFTRIHQNEDGEWTYSLLDPRTMTIFWNAGIVRSVLFYRMEWQIGKQAFRQDTVPVWLLNNDRTNPWMMGDLRRDGSESKRPEGWVIIEYEQNQRKEWVEVTRDIWDFPFAPIVDWANQSRPHTYYGQTSLSNPGLNDSINFVASNTARIIKYHAHPKTIGVGVDPEKIVPTPVDGFYSVPEGADVHNLEMQSDLMSSMNMLNLLKGEFFASQRVIDIATVQDKLGQITNFGVRMMFSDMLSMCDEMRKRYGKGLGETLRRLLWVQGVQLEERPTAHWDDPLPINRLELLQAAQIESGLGTTSKQTLAKDLGRDYVVEVERRDEETTDAGQAMARVLTAAGNAGVFA